MPLFDVPEIFRLAIMAAVASFAAENVATHPFVKDFAADDVKMAAPAVGVVPVVNTTKNPLLLPTHKSTVGPVPIPVPGVIVGADDVASMARPLTIP